MNIEYFINPPVEYWPVPFWSWNDLMEPEELRRQIKEFAAQGFGGFFMHSRPGLETSYLSEDWFECIKTCVEEAKKQKVKAWLYDEDKWPSGYGGGQVAPLKEEYRNKALCMAENTIPHPEEMFKIIKVYLADKVTTFKSGFAGAELSSKLVNLREIPADEIPERTSEQVLLYFYQLTAQLGDPWFNGASYVDLLNPDVTDAFIEATHEKYSHTFKDEFGSTIPGIFTDEPLYVMQFRWGVRVLPWTSRLPEEFEAEYGYNILDSLQQLFYPFEGYEKVRYDFRMLLNRLFLESYTKKVYQWCSSNGLKYTGHYMCEDDIVRNMDWVGSIMQHYEFMHYPGIDHLSRRADDIITQKQLQSVSNQFGKERALSETFACSGQNVSFEQLKWIADWQFVNGVNLINPHLSSYSMRGERKRDYPPNIFYQQPWWEYAHHLTAYFSRLSYILSQGERILDVLVIHPIESGFIAYSPLDVSSCQEINNNFEKTLFTLMENHYDFDLGDEGIVQNHGRVSGNELQVGKSRYKVVVLPPLITLRSSTLELLKQFIENGGKVVAIQGLPSHIDGKPAKEGIEEYLKDAELSAFHMLDKTMQKLIRPNVSIELGNGDSAKKIFYHQRKIDGKSVYFFANNDNEKDYNCTICLKGQGTATILDPLTGASQEQPAESRDGYTCITHHFSRCGSLLVTLGHLKSQTRESVEGSKLEQVFAVNAPWDLKVLEKNALTIDYCSYSTEGKGFSTPLHHLSVLKDIKKQAKSFTLCYSFDVKGWNGEEGELIVESPEKYSITMNGQPLEFIDNGYWKDISFRRTPVAGRILEGRNIIEISSEYSDTIEIEAIYIIGNFKVESEGQKRFYLTPAGDMKFIKNLSEEGFPFYSGKVEISGVVNLKTEVTCQYVLNLGKLDAIVADISVNSMKVGNIFWKPYEIDITPYIKDGINTITLCLVNSLHNLLGPHHNVSGEAAPSVGPGSFRVNSKWSDIYYFTPYGVEQVCIKEQQNKTWRMINYDFKAKH